MDRLHPFLGTRIIIEPANDEESREAARQISSAVKSAGWEILDAIPHTMPIKPGVYVQSSTAPPPDPGIVAGQDTEYCKHQISRQAADALIRVLAIDNKWNEVDSNYQAGIYVSPEDRIPAGEVRVLVGIKRTKPLFNPQYQAMGRQENEAGERAGREKAASAMTANPSTN